MRSALDEYLIVSRELRIFVDSIAPADSMLARQKVPILRESRSIRRRLDYAAFIVALYSAFESLVEALVWSHAELMASRSRYFDLPPKLQAAHLQKSANILMRRPGEGRYSRVEPSEIVANLHACLSGGTAYRLNKHAVVHHDMNLRAGVVQEMFGLLGIDNVSARVRHAEPMLEWFQHSQGRDVEEAGSIPETLIDRRMDELVSRRNQVVHSGGDPAESLAPEEMRSRLEFLDAYSQSLFVVLACAYLEQRYVKPGAAHALGRPLEGPIQGKSVVVVKKPSCRLFPGQALIGSRNGHVDRWGQVTELREDGVTVESIDQNSPCQEVGLRADFRLTKGMELFVLEERDVAVWG